MKLKQDKEIAIPHALKRFRSFYRTMEQVSLGLTARISRLWQLYHQNRLRL